MAGSSTTKQLPPQHQVFINFFGADVRHGFVSHLVKALTSNNINVYNDGHEVKSETPDILLERIEESRIALVIFSKSYTKVRWCLTELTKIADCVEKRKLVAIPIFYKVYPSTVRHQMGQFGDAFRDLVESDAIKKKEWEEALQWISNLIGFTVNERSSETEIIKRIVDEIKIVLNEASVDLNKLFSRQTQPDQKQFFFPAMVGSSTIKQLPPQHQVFINFRGADVRYGFVSHLVKALTSNNINVYNDGHEVKSETPDILLERIEESRIALVIFSKSYTKVRWCLTELTKIADCVEKRKLVAIPIFYKVDPSTVRHQMGQFGDAFRDLVESDAIKKKEWEEAMQWISNLIGFTVNERSNENEIIERIVDEVKRVLKRRQRASVDPSENIETGIYSGREKNKTFGIKQCLKELGNKLDLNKIRSQLGMIIGCLLLLFFCLQQVGYNMMSTSLIGEGGAIDRIVESAPKVLEFIPSERTENPRDKYTEVPTGKYGAKPERSSSDTKMNADRTFTNFPTDDKVKPPNIQVFINFRGDQLRKYFISYLADALRKSGINIFIDTKANIGDDLINLFKRIDDSGIAIVVFSSRYTESEWCLNELVKITERAHQGLLKVLPIFYKVTPGNVKRLKGEFGDNFRDKEYMYAFDEHKIKQWKDAIVFVSHKFALTFDEKSSVLEVDFIETIVKEVLKMLQAISTMESGQSSR